MVEMVILLRVIADCSSTLLQLAKTRQDTRDLWPLYTIPVVLVLSRNWSFHSFDLSHVELTDQFLQPRWPCWVKACPFGRKVTGSADFVTFSASASQIQLKKKKIIIN